MTPTSPDAFSRSMSPVRPMWPARPAFILPTPAATYTPTGRHGGKQTMSIYSASMKHRSFVWQISAVSFFLGLLLAAATVTASKVGSAGPRPTAPVSSMRSNVTVDPDKKAADLQERDPEARADKAALEKAASNRSDVSKNLNQDLQETRLFAGLSEVTGPGVVVTLTDSKKDRLSGWIRRAT